MDRNARIIVDFMAVRQERDGLQVRVYHWPSVYISWVRKKWTSGWTLTTTLLFVFTETGDRWASC